MVDFNKIAIKWQKRWEASKIFNVKEDPKKKKFYVLEMYPYPSGSGLHMGHARNYCIGDAFARFKRMQGFNVLYPMGYDSFGLPAENAAIKEKSHPKIFTENAIKNFIKQQKSLGLSYDWNRMVETHKPDYYKWDQWIFLKMFEKGMAYKRKSAVNWCPKCHTVLANEQVHNGKCWRHTETDVEPKELEQWFFKTTKYADELYDDIKKLTGWEEDVKLMQKNWINKKEWIDIEYDIDGTGKKLTVSTTRPDTNFGATFIVIAPEHPLLSKETGIVPEKYKRAVDDYIEKAKKKTDEERIEEGGKKQGVFTGLYCINQLTNKKMPVWVTDFVLMTVGTGVVVGVPGHDIRDFEFAKEYDLEIIRVVVGKDRDKTEITRKEQVQEEEGTMINSGFLNGMDIHTATKKIMDYMEEKGYGKRTIRYRLRDWLISRQRFWGTPIPIIYCDKCGEVPVPEKDLPVKLPDNIKFSSTKNPLMDYKPFTDVKCPKCKGPAKRETDTMDTFVNSSWYFLRYCDPKNDKKIFDPKKANYWMPIDQYIGGREHACMHLIYFRFYTKFLRDLGLIKFDEPAINLFNQGMLHKNGVVMSKSKGNVVLPEEVADKYGIDTARLFLLFVAGPDKDMEWSDESVEGNFRFLNKFYSLVDKKITDKKDSKQESKINKTIKECTSYIEEFKFNMAIISLMELTNYLYVKDEINKSVLEKLVLLMGIFTPHICEEMWEKLGNKEFISTSKWPKFDKSKIDEKSEAEEESISKLILDINKVLELAKVETPKKITLFVSEKWKYDFFSKIKKSLAKTRDIGTIIKSCMDSEHKKEISQLVPKLVKNESRIPKVIIEQSSELKNLEQNKKLVEDNFKCKVDIVKADDSQGAKAIPSKPAIFVE
ncbi:leucine--tRNA ligase [Candidatus Woesearchaeota archaeon B3_Woes]|nr:MAG: leucine--tRNA ligase [Candidatus Woesearchaeota archaeon B3_Woes]